VWVWLFGLWIIYDTPLLQLGLGSGLSARSAAFVSLLVFCFLTATLFSAPLRLFYRATFLPAAAIFIGAFLFAFLLSGVLSGSLALMLSFSTLWLFILLFAACVAVVTRFYHA
jgi:hypothetical protein